MKATKLLIPTILCVIPASAGVTLPAWLTDNMVVQRNDTLPFIGKARPNHMVTVQPGWSDSKYSAKAGSDGMFRIDIPTPEAGGPYMITISDGKKKTLKNVMSGDVWFCSGQSNMEMPLAGWGKVKDYEKEIANSSNPDIRLLEITDRYAYQPASDVDTDTGGWVICGPGAVDEFSSTGYFFGRDIQKELNIPIGLIDCAWGGTMAECWTPAGDLKNVATYSEKLAAMSACGFERSKLEDIYAKEKSDWFNQFDSKDAGMSGKRLPIWTESFQKGTEWADMKLPTLWERAGYEFDGSGWFQKNVEIPSAWIGKPLTLSLGKIDDYDFTYVNGAEVGHTDGHLKNRKYEIPASLNNRANLLITVRVLDFGGGGGIYGDAADMKLVCGKDSLSLAGNWSFRKGTDLKGVSRRPVSPGDVLHYPSLLYNAMVAPLTDFPIKGVIWYQGESNEDNASDYASLLPTMINGWRKVWNRDLPFHIVQLTGFREPMTFKATSRWAVIREAQQSTARVAGVSMIPTLDIGEAKDIHPKNKQEVGRRLALVALDQTYGKGEFHYPRYLNHSFDRNSVVIELSEPVRSRGDSAEGFVIEGGDGKFYDATAEIHGNKVILKAEMDAVPVGARYGWADNPICNIEGMNGMPLAPFRTTR